MLDAIKDIEARFIADAEKKLRLFDQALTALDALLMDEDDFERASRLNSAMIELTILRHAIHH